MKSIRAATVLMLVFSSTSLLAQSDAQKVLDRFKAMAGTWEGKSPKGQTSKVKYELVAGGTAVMSESQMIGDDMTSMFYVDGERLMMTHFCPSGNQPFSAGFRRWGLARAEVSVLASVQSVEILRRIRRHLQE